MTDATPTTIRVSQLIYSNVEAEHSVTGRRGFQVWLCSGRIKEQQRDIARRLEDFEWPAKDAAANKPTERSAFFKTPAGDYVVARTVPLTERDVLKRAGRFHAHAVVVTPSEFARIGNDPFRLLDHFPFQSSPTPLIESGEWKKGLPDLMDQEIGVAKEGDPALAGVVSRLLPTLVRWLDGKPDDPRPIAVPVMPERLAALLRVILHALPPTLRERVTFDTLSTGQTLNALPFRFAGAYDGPTLRDWPYRRAYRLDPETGDFSTPPEAPENADLDHLAREWSKDPTLPDAEREGSYALLKALLDPNGKLPETISDQSMELVQSAPSAATAFARMVRGRLTKDLPYPHLRALIEGPAREWIGPVSRAALGRLAAPIPTEELTGWLMKHGESQPLTAEQAAELEQWAFDHLKTADGASRTQFAKLFLIALRWSPNGGGRLAELREEQGWPKLLDTWFNPWFVSNTPLRAWLETEENTRQFAEAVFEGAPRLGEDTLPELERLLAVVGPAAFHQAISYKQLVFAAAFRRKDAGRMSWALAEQDDNFTRWVIEEARKVGFIVALGVGGLEQLPGVLVLPPDPPPDGAEALLEALGEHPHVRTLLYYDYGVHTAEQMVPPPMVSPTAVVAAFDAISKKKGLDQELARLGGTNFRFFITEKLLDKARVTRLTHSLSDGSHLWVGPQIDPIGVYPEAFQLVYGAVLRVIRSDSAQMGERVAALIAAVSSRSR